MPFCFQSALSQDIEVVYMEEMATSIRINSNNSVDTKSSCMKNQMVLINAKGESIYKPLRVNNTEEDGLPVDGSPGMKIVMMGGDVKVYKNQGLNELISEEFIMDKKFLIKEKLINFDWKLLDDEQDVNGYKCKKAVAGQTVAWYCPEIPINDGPYIFWGLPGLIIKLQHQNKTVTATEIIVSNINDKIDVPREGKVVTRDAFNEIMMKKMRKMGTPSSQGSNVQVEILQR